MYSVHCTVYNCQWQILLLVNSCTVRFCVRQVEGKLGNPSRSAELCHTTLDRQLLADREMLDWKGKDDFHVYCFSRATLYCLYCIIAKLL